MQGGIRAGRGTFACERLAVLPTWTSSWILHCKHFTICTIAKTNRWRKCLYAHVLCEGRQKEFCESRLPCCKVMLVSTWRATTSLYTSSGCLHKLFKGQMPPFVASITARRWMLKLLPYHTHQPTPLFLLSVSVAIFENRSLTSFRVYTASRKWKMKDKMSITSCCSNFQDGAICSACVNQPLPFSTFFLLSCSSQ